MYIYSNILRQLTFAAAVCCVCVCESGKQTMRYKCHTRRWGQSKTEEGKESKDEK